MIRHLWRFSLRFFVVHFVAKQYIPQQVSEGTNRNMCVRNTLVQLLAAYTNPESHNAQRYRQTDGQQAAVNSRSYCVAVRSAKNPDDDDDFWRLPFIFVAVIF